MSALGPGTSSHAVDGRSPSSMACSRWRRLVGRCGTRPPAAQYGCPPEDEGSSDSTVCRDLMPGAGAAAVDSGEMGLPLSLGATLTSLA
jgi:hypothetical protein